jgi:prepilin-type N-terminal cleavage/methylation domain-containing protein
MRLTGTHKGYSLVEMVLVIIILGVLASVAMRALNSGREVSRTRTTRQGLDRLAVAIAGDPQVTSGGFRADFGYVGDIGALPPNLGALMTNSGGYATWKGPYLNDRFAIDGGGGQCLVDGWGVSYNYSGGLSISSTGSSISMTRLLAGSLADLLYNPVHLVIVDQKLVPPGSVYGDSLLLRLTYPDGAGGMTARSRSAFADGSVSFDSIPIGSHQLQVVYQPENDTLRRQVCVHPGQMAYIEIQYPREVW